MSQRRSKVIAVLVAVVLLGILRLQSTQLSRHRTLLGGSQGAEYGRLNTLLGTSKVEKHCFCFALNMNIEAIG